MILLLFIISVCASFIVTNQILNRDNTSSNHLTYSVAVATTLSIISYLYYTSLVFDIRIDMVLLLFTACCTAITAYRLLARKDNTTPADRSLGLNSSLILAISVLILTIRFNKHLHRWGDWDAYAIWTHHAKFLFYPEYWKAMFTNRIAGSHPDYPLMLPAVTAILWRAIGFITPIVPIAISYLVFSSISVMIFSSLVKFGRNISAIISLIIIVITAKYINIAASQYADTLLAFFITTTFVLYKDFKHKNTITIVPVLGFIAGSTTWIKNEGILFFLAFSIAFFYFYYKKRDIILQYIFGCMIPIIAIIHFKVQLAPKNDLVNSDRGAEVLSMIFDPSRYILILEHAATTIFSYYWILIVLIIGLLINKKPFSLTLPTVAICIVLFGYFSIYLTTPNDLNWHLGASIDRLFHHLFPASIYLLLMKLSSNVRDDERRELPTPVQLQS